MSSLDLTPIRQFSSGWKDARAKVAMHTTIEPIDLASQADAWREGFMRASDCFDLGMGRHGEGAFISTHPALPTHLLRRLFPLQPGDVVANVGEVQSWPYQETDCEPALAKVYVMARSTKGDPSSCRPVSLWSPVFGISWRLVIDWVDSTAQAVFEGTFHEVDEEEDHPSLTDSERNPSINDGRTS